MTSAPAAAAAPEEPRPSSPASFPVGRFGEVRRLVAQAQAGDRQALDRLVREYTGLVCQLACRYSRHCRADFEDYRQVAYLALLLAVRRWDEGRAQALGTTSFTTYAQRAIESRLRRHQLLDHVVRAPINLRDVHGRAIRCPVAWLDAPSRGKDSDDGPPPLLSLAAGDDIESTVADEERSARVRAAVDVLGLPSRTLDVLRRRLLDGEEFDLVGARWGISGERARQIVQSHQAQALAAIAAAFTPHQRAA